MDTEFLTAQQSEDLQRLSGNPSPFSEEELKDFYLKLARLVNPGACSPKRTDFEVLSILSKDLKRNLGFYVSIRNTPGMKDCWKYKWPAEFIPYRTVSPKRSD